MRSPAARTVLAELLLVASCGAFAAPRAAAAQLDEIRLEPVVTGLPAPVAVTHAGDGRLFVSFLTGQVAIVEDGELRGTFLDLSDQILGGGFGLFSIAFHPDYADNGFFFVHYAAKSGASVISRFEVSSRDPNRSVKSSEKVLLEIPKEERLHYGGQLAFGPDGFLYVSTGDGTGMGRRVDPHCSAQSVASLEGKILRLDVDRNVDTPPYYGVPPENPFVATGRGEVWALGLRNPWRFSFDRETGDLWLTDVGQDRREEIDFEPASSPGGRNYGWKVVEGDLCFNDRAGCPSTLPPCGDATFTPPVYQYSHAEGRCSVIGGQVYRGREIAGLNGRYLYGDYCTGEIRAARYDGAHWQTEPLPFTVPQLTSFGEDASGEIWLTGNDTLYRLTGPAPPEPVEPCAPDENRLCLNRGRFEVKVDWRTSEGATGLGHAVPLGEDAGMFWFFSANNPELFVKVLDGCFEPFNHYWVFAAGLTEVATSLTVVDTQTGDIKRYDGALGQPYFPIRDTQAFATCP